MATFLRAIAARYGNVFSSLFLLMACSLSGFAQNKAPDSSAYTLLAEIAISTHYATSDKLQQLYIADTNNTISKYAPDGTLLFQYNNNTLGDVNFIDATDPFNILVYYPDFKTLITLDRTLNKTGEFNLFDMDIVDVQVVAMSSGNTIWFYDNARFKLKKVNPSGTIQVESEDLSLGLNAALKPNFMIERGNYVYINDPLLGIYVFDIFGQYVQQLELKGLQEFQILKNRLVYLKGQQLHTFHLDILADKTIDLPQTIEEKDKVYIQKDKLFWVGDQVIRFYEF